MKNKLIITGLLAVIIVTFGFVGLKLQAAGPDDNYFNQHLRSGFARYPLFRQILGLHYDGDAAADYLSGRYDRVAISIAAEAGVELAPKVLRDFADKLTEITGKKISYGVSPTQIPTADVAAKTPLQLEVGYRKLHSESRTATLFLLLLDSDPQTPDLLGSTLGEDGIILYVGALKDFTSRFPRTESKYEFSTLLHEFGHQLGLAHNNFENCLMNEHAEHGESFIELPSDVLVDFCQREYGQILKIREQFNK